MYCSSCGAAAARGLNYCKQCGAKLNAAGDGEFLHSAPADPDSLVWAMVTVFVAGLGATIGLMSVMKKVLEFRPGLIIALSLLCFSLMLTIEGVFIWLLMGRKRKSREAGDISRLKEQLMKELSLAQKPGLPDPSTGVTEHTTQTLEPIYIEPKSK